MSKFEVLDSSGAIDAYDEEDYGPTLTAEMSMDLGGALMIVEKNEKREITLIHAIYAPGMWMKFEIIRSDDAEPTAT